MLRILLVLMMAAVFVGTALSGAGAQNSEWPSQMNIAGFTITGINGSGSSATGTLQIPGFGGHRIELARSGGGDVTGRASINARGSGLEIQGNFSLNNSGLRGNGTIKSNPRPITDAAITFSSSGQATGSGRVAVGRTTVTANFNVSSGSLSANGSSSVKDSKSTALANYEFKGTLSLQGNSGRLGAVASGRVHRTGKLADQVTTYDISNAPVDVASGQCTVNIGGVSVTFTF